MKKLSLTLLAVFLFLSTINAQKLTPDVDLISELVSQKQDEVKRRVLKNLIVKNIKTTNYTTYNSMYYLMDIITTEKNKTVMTKGIIKEVAEYAINYSLAEYFIKNKLEESDLEYFIIDKDDKSKVSERNAKNDYNALASLIGTKFRTINANSNLETRQSTIKQKNIKEINEKRYWEANYIIDQLYEKLSGETVSILTDSIGIFKKENLERLFKNGLKIDYNDNDKIKKNRREYIDKKLGLFVKEIDSFASTNISVKIFGLLNKFKDLNFKKLNEAPKENIRVLFELFAYSLTDFRAQIGKNSFLAKIGGIIDKYVIYQLSKSEDKVFENFKIDVEAIILTFEDEFVKKTYLKRGAIGIKPFFMIGLNYAVFTNSNTTILEDNGSSGIYDLAFVSEKFGFKIMLADFGYARSHKPNEWYKYKGKYYKWNRPKSEPLIDEIFITVYGSGILYNVVDLKSKDNFDFGLVGVGAGINFFNNLELNISYAVPFIDKSLSYKNGMVSLGFDIPIFEYLGALKRKNK